MVMMTSFHGPLNLYGLPAAHMLGAFQHQDGALGMASLHIRRGMSLVIALPLLHATRGWGVELLQVAGLHTEVASLPVHC